MDPPRPWSVGRLSATHGLLWLVALMAVVSGSALWWTLQQARQLAHPDQQADLWYVASVNNELARLQLLARQIVSGEATADELQTRLDVLASVLDSTEQLPRLKQHLHTRLPETAAVLAEVDTAATSWSQLLGPQPALGSERTAREIVRRGEGLQQRLRQAVADVHVASSDDNDIKRQQLQQRFVVLRTVLAALFVGAAALVWRLIHDIRRARDTTRSLALINQQLEARVTERTRKIEEGRLLLQFILDASPSDVLLIDAELGTVFYVNRRLLSRLGLRSAPACLQIRELMPDAAQGQALVDHLARYGEVDGMEALIGHQPPCWSSLSGRLIEVEGRLAHLLWGFDISAHKALEAQLRELATTDPLTGLDNRRAFLDKGRALLEHCRRHRQNCGVLMLDIDRFKNINDQHGHRAGDDAIVACARALRETLRESDILGRFGGEEFAALLPHANDQATLETAERVRLAVQALRIGLGGDLAFGFTISIGFSALADRSASLEQLLAEADTALYRAKADGRNRVVAHAPTALLD